MNAHRCLAKKETEKEGEGVTRPKWYIFIQMNRGIGTGEVFLPMGPKGEMLQNDGVEMAKNGGEG